MLQKDYIYIENVFTKKQCKELIKEFNKRKEEAIPEHCTHASNNVDTTSTFTRVELIPKTKSFNLVHNATKHMTKQWIKYLRKLDSTHSFVVEKNLNFVHMYRLMCYEKGGWIHPHIDWSEFTHASCTILLNDDYEGGEFSFFNGKHDVKMKAGQAMIFPANAYWVHEVKEIKKGKRYSTNCFILSLPVERQAQLNSMAWDFKNVKNHDLSLKD